MATAIHFAALLVVAGSLLAFGGTKEPLDPVGDAEASVVDVVAAREADRTDGPDEVVAIHETDQVDERTGGDGADESDEAEGVAVDEAEATGETGETGGPDDDDVAGDSESASLIDHPDGGKRRPRGGCPSTMVRSGSFCIDRYEAPNRRGARPFVMQSANDANSWCTDHHKRLCNEDEWIAACQGEERRTYPYGNEHVDGRCNDDKAWQKVDEAVLAKWPAPEAKAHAKELYQGTPSGSKRKCVSEVGARDMTGNVEEWVLRTRSHTNDWPYILIGCYWSGCYGGNKPTCHSTNNAHGPEFRFYETGFRCCKDVNSHAGGQPPPR